MSEFDNNNNNNNNHIARPITRSETKKRKRKNNRSSNHNNLINHNNIQSNNNNHDSKTNTFDNNSLKQVYYAATHLSSDLKIIYMDTCFHLHKHILAKESIYFHNLIEGSTNDHPIIIPAMNVIIEGNYCIPPNLFRQLFDIIYLGKKILFDEIIHTDEKPAVYHATTLQHLIYYFGCYQLQTNLEDILIEWINKWPKNAFIIKYLYAAQQYKWDRLLKTAVKAIASNLNYYRTDTCDHRGLTGKGEYVNMLHYSIMKLEN